MNAGILQKRRSELRRRLAGGAALLANGSLRFRNSLSNPYPFRGSSHFLFFFGVMPPGAVGVIGRDGDMLFLDRPSEDDALWVGTVPSAKAMASRAGVRDACFFDDLAVFVSGLPGSSIFSLPTLDPVTNDLLTDLLGRPPDVEGADRALALAVFEQRIRHDEAAREELRKAAEVATSAFVRGMQTVGPDSHERIVRAEMKAVVEASGSALSFEPIVTIEGEVLHQNASANALRSGELLLVDFGTETSEGYACDVTRVFPVSGKFTPTQRRAYETVLAAQQEAAALLSPARPFREVHFRAAEVIAEGLIEMGVLRGCLSELLEREVFRIFFPHGIGHPIGLDVHDMEDLGSLVSGSAEKSEALRYLRFDHELGEHMAVTLEPGMYFVPPLLAQARVSPEIGAFIDFSRVEEVSREVRGIRIEDVYLLGDEMSCLTGGIPKRVDDVEEALLGVRDTCSKSSFALARASH